MPGTVLMNKNLAESLKYLLELQPDPCPRYRLLRDMVGFPSLDSPRFSSWLDGLMLLSRFPHAGQVISPSLEWIWQQRNSDGL